MAASTKLHLEFNTNTSSKATFNFNYADPNVSDNDVKALMNVMITSGAIFENVPISIDSAKLVVTTEQALNVKD